MDSLQEAFIYATELREACFIMDAHALFDVFWTVEQTPTHCNNNTWKCQDYL